MSNASNDLDNVIKAALDHVYTDEQKLIEDCAKEHAIANMGQTLKGIISSGYGGYGTQSVARFTKNPEQLVSACYSAFYGGSESEEMADGIDCERRSFLKDSKRDVAKVKKAGLPLTIANVHLAFLSKPPFDKASAPKKKSR